MPLGFAALIAALAALSPSLSSEMPTGPLVGNGMIQYLMHKERNLALHAAHEDRYDLLQGRFLMADFVQLEVQSSCRI